MKAIMIYRSGLPTRPSKELFELEIDSCDLILSQIELKAIGKNKVIQSYRIPLMNIVECGFVSEQEFIEKDKNVIGRGLAGGLLFGPAGMVLGGMSGIGNKKKKTTVGLFVITYLSENSPDELRSFVLETGWNNRDLTNIKFAKEAGKISAAATKSSMVNTYLNHYVATNQDGSITL